MSIIVGWDVGGAHLKAACADNGRIVAAIQVPSPLRLGVARLATAFAEAKAAMGTATLHAVTMTGELADTFASRREGVEALAAMATRELAAPVTIYAGRAGFISPKEVPNHIEDIASANWHASAALTARMRRTALLIDMGSTTTDLVPVSEGRITATGYTDAERLAAGELAYTGLVRSPVMTIARHAPVAGKPSLLINEHFATMADVHRILGNLPADADQMVTADGRDKSIEASRARLARMVGRDVTDGDDTVWSALARWFAEAQIRTITDAALLVLSRENLPPDAPVVGAGIGEQVIREVARRLARDYVAFDCLLDVAEEARDWASHCAPAAALALLAHLSS